MSGGTMGTVKQRSNGRWEARIDVPGGDPASGQPDDASVMWDRGGYAVIGAVSFGRHRINVIEAQP
jgi:hypothetical protein